MVDDKYHQESSESGLQKTKAVADAEENAPVAVKSWFVNARANPLFALAVLGGIVIALADQASKVWIVRVLRLPDLRQIELTPAFDFTYVQNYGASFGMLAGGLASRVFLSALTIGIIVFVLHWLASVRRKLPAIGIAFILGGALGNLTDRVLYGYVIDFIDFSALFFPWVFNVADMAINVGVGCLILDAVLESRRAKDTNNV